MSALAASWQEGKPGHIPLGDSSASTLVHAEGPGQVFDPGDLGFNLGFGVVLREFGKRCAPAASPSQETAVMSGLAHAEPGQSRAPEDFTKGLGVAGGLHAHPGADDVSVNYLELQAPGAPAPTSPPSQATAA